MTPILVIGDLAAEVRLRGLTGHPRRGAEVFVSGARLEPGGRGGRLAAALARLGREVILVGKIGNDELGKAIRRTLHPLLDTSRIGVDSNRGTGLVIAFSDEVDASLVTFPGATATLSGRDVASLPLDRGGHLHVVSPFHLLGLSLAPLLRKARRQGMTVSISVGADPRGRSDLSDLYASVHVLLLGEAEAKALGGVRKLAARVPLVVVRRGGKGAVAVTAGGEWKAAAPAAGPVFDAAFIDGWLDGHRVQELLTYAGAAEELALDRGGGIGTTPTRAEVLHQVGRRTLGRKPR
ncbi:MAG TPA: carbohydrate kinase family protein [Planctomycetota bacterium]|nr:carbohydrate kinase family protein [Planctomycetota bacterium]